MELYVNSRPKLNTSYNVEHGVTNISMLIYTWPFRQLSHSNGVGTSRTLEDRIIWIYDENRIKTVYCNQRRYDSFNLGDNKDEGVMSLVEKLDDDEASYYRIWSWYWSRWHDL
jgi:hypothetical protein